MPVEDVKRLGRSTQGVIVMRLRGDDETVSALAPVVESEATGSMTDRRETCPDPRPLDEAPGRATGRRRPDASYPTRSSGPFQ